MRKRPSIALAAICKNEKKNIERFLDSNSGCFDKIYIADTGSTDGTVEWIKENGERVAKCPVVLSHFDWIDDFSAARNFVFSQVKEDYILWEDLDDVLSDKDAFIQWRDFAMEFGDYWLNTYHYAIDDKGVPQVSFVRERVFKRTINPTWNYPLHEGVTPNPAWQRDYAVSWSVKHLRDAEDMAADKSRNLNILEKMEKKDGRMMFYWGKELYEANKPNKALDVFEQTLKRDDLENHDKVLAHQYAGYAAQACGDMLKDELKAEKDAYYDKAIKFCLDGIALDPHRAEFYVGIGDSYLKKGNLMASIPHYTAAKSCINPTASGTPYFGAIYYFADCYGLMPCIQLSKVYFNLGMIDKAKAEAKEAAEKFNSEEAKKIYEEALRIENLVDINSEKTQTEDIVFSCPPNSAYPFDEEIYKTKGMGGSETALIEMAMHLKKLTGRRVIVFNNRQENMVGESGVEWVSTAKVTEYFSSFKPRVHIAWRHNIKLTNATTYLWCHDLVTGSVESMRNFDKMFCLSEFHKNYVMAKQNVPEDMIIVTRNGLTPEKFDFEKKPKNPNKMVYLSSPDRGLDKAILVCDKVKKVFPEIELHLYYGRENLRKYGMIELADKIDKLIETRPWVIDHGFTEQRKMYRDVSDAAVWIHPTAFIETFMITAIEQLALGTYPVTRRVGAISNTLAEAESKGQATLLDELADSDEIIEKYANAVIAAIKEKKWEGVNLDISKHSWESIAKEWIGIMGLNC